MLLKAKGGEVMTGYAAGGELMLQVFQSLDVGGGRACFAISVDDARKMAAEIFACTGPIPTEAELRALVAEIS